MNKVIFALSLILAIGLLSNGAYAACVTPANNTAGFLVNNTTTLCGGVYYNNTTITINNDSLIFDCNSSTLDGFDDTKNAITVSNHDDVTIQYCYIINYSAGIVAADADNLTIFDNEINDCDMYAINTYRTTNSTWSSNQIFGLGDTAYAIRLDDTDVNITISDSYMEDLTDYGIVITQNDNFIHILNNTINYTAGGTAGRCIYNTGGDNVYIYNNTLSECGYGIEVTNITNITIDNNEIYTNLDSGISILNGTANSTFMIITNNKIYDDGLECVALDSISTGLIQNNSLYLCGQLTLGDAALWIDDSKDTQILGNRIYSSDDDGIRLANVTTFTITGNNISFNGDDGIQFSENATLISMISNTIQNNTMDGIYSTLNYLVNSYITSNNIYDNLNNGIDIPCESNVSVNLSIASNWINNSGGNGIVIEDCGNVTATYNNATFNTGDGILTKGLGIYVTGGFYCNNSATWDVEDNGFTNFFTLVSCDTSSGATCTYTCVGPPTGCTQLSASDKLAFEMGFLIFMIILAAFPLIASKGDLSLGFIIPWILAIIVIAVFAPSLFTMLC